MRKNCDRISEVVDFSKGMAPEAAISDIDEHHAVYRQDSVITIRDVERELQMKRTRDDIKSGGLFCSHGAAMTFVICSNKSNHFRHVSLTGPKTSGGTSSTQPPPVQCGCSSRHLNAQALLRDHDYTTQPVAFTEWRDCKQPSCCKTVYTTTGNLEVRLEVRECGGKFVSDVVYYEEDGKACMRVEVLATHKADRARRAGTEFVEVSADHVAASFKNAGTSQIVLRCEGSCTGKHEVCLRCAHAAKLAAEARRIRAEEMAKNERGRRVAEERKLQEERWRIAEKRRLQEERWRIAMEQRSLEEHGRIVMEAMRQAEERDRIAALNAERAEREVKKAEVAAGMAVTPIPNFSVTIGTDVPMTNQEEIEERRRERMERRAAAAAQTRQRARKKHK